eukprot:m.218971 g.218971  ORF g.218971 m.218971 type:complete len:73 (-) comp54126_c0_seq2:62-280(-)
MPSTYITSTTFESPDHTPMSSVYAYCARCFLGSLLLLALLLSRPQAASLSKQVLAFSSDFPSSLKSFRSSER